MDLSYVVAHWENVRGGLIATIAKFRDDELDFKPFEASRSVREMILHIAHEGTSVRLWNISGIRRIASRVAVKAPTVRSVRSTSKRCTNHR
jgi:hypothetical protein